MVAIDTLREQTIELLALWAHGVSEPSPLHVQILSFAQRRVVIPSEVLSATIACHFTKSDELLAAWVMGGLGHSVRDYIAIPCDKNYHALDWMTLIENSEH
jgi:hypothetical protein